MDILIVIVIIVALVFIIIRNKIVYLKESMNKSNALINVFLKKRYDLIPNIIDATKGYANYEQETIFKVTAIRQNFDTSNEMAKDVMENEYNAFMAKVESYPQLKSDVVYLNLQKTLSEIEGEIASARRLYIMDASKYNILIQKIPYSIVASLFKYLPVKYNDYNLEEIQIDLKKNDHNPVGASVEVKADNKKDLE